MAQSHTQTRTPTPRRKRVLRPRAESLEGRRLLSASDLDLSFSGDGWAAVSPSADPKESFSDFASDVALLDGGKVLVFGASQGKFGLARLLGNGELDTSFGTGGRVRTDLSPTQLYGDMALQADGKIVVVGMVDNGYQAGRRDFVYNRDMAVVRYNADGSLDATFGVGGVVKTNVSTYGNDTPGDSGNKYDAAYGVVVQGDGKIVVTGETLVGSNTYNAVLARYTATGGLDTTFGSGGIVVSPAARNFRSPAVQADGKIVVSSGAAPLARFNADGTPDSGFGTGGMVPSSALPGVTNGARRVLIQADGKIVTQVTTSNGLNDDIGLLRVLADGTPDPAFGTGGAVRLDLGKNERSGGLALAPDGSVIVAGYQVNAGNDGLIARLTPQGALDPTFTPPSSPTPGVLIRSLSSERDEFNAAAVDPLGRIVTVGTWDSDSRSGAYEFDFLVARHVGTSASPLLAPAAAAVPVRRALTAAQARPVLGEALAYWRARGADTSRLGRVDLAIADLGGARLGEASGSTITLDDNAAGWGWSSGRGRGRTAGRMDLLSALVHEVGHLLGRDHAEGGVMAETLAPGVRQLGADPGLVAIAKAGHDHPLAGIPRVPSRPALGAFRVPGRWMRAAALG